MSAINLLDVTVLNAEGAPFLSGFSFQITFECVLQLAGELEWRVVYVGSSKSEAHDQELDSVLVGPVAVGISRFVLDVPAPDPAKIPADDLLGATAVMLTCAYKGKEFVKVGYWVSNAPKVPTPEGARRGARARAAWRARARDAMQARCAARATRAASSGRRRRTRG
jgi:histone chaperone ASF1